MARTAVSSPDLASAARAATSDSSGTVGAVVTDDGCGTE